MQPTTYRAWEEADTMFEYLGMIKKDTQKIVDGTVVEHEVEYHLEDDGESGAEPTSIFIIFNLLDQTFRYGYYPGIIDINQIQVLIAIHKKMVELKWVEGELPKQEKFRIAMEKENVRLNKLLISNLEKGETQND